MCKHTNSLSLLHTHTHTHTDTIGIWSQGVLLAESSEITAPSPTPSAGHKTANKKESEKPAARATHTSLSTWGVGKAVLKGW